MSNPSMSRNQTLLWLGIFFAVLVWSVIDPKDLPTWGLEVFPAIIGVIVLALTFHRFPLTPLCYWLILAHCIILMVGGHYTYAEVPLFDWIDKMFDLGRNDYDKLGHFAQGFVPVFIAREIFIRRRIVNGAKWTNFLAVCVCLAVSAFYELIEWVVALVSDQAADSFLGTQGYIWDTQSDMAFALFGASVGILLFAGFHDRQIARLGDIGVPQKP